MHGSAALWEYADPERGTGLGLPALGFLPGGLLLSGGLIGALLLDVFLIRGRVTVHVVVDARLRVQSVSLHAAFFDVFAGRRDGLMMRLGLTP